MTRTSSLDGAERCAVASKRPSRLLTTKQLPEITGLSKSFFDKGRIYNYGPPYIRVGSGGRSGRIFYYEADVLDWMAARICDPEVCHA
jgi:predicted DNA-binding transcriptional regulator AlpA